MNRFDEVLEEKPNYIDDGYESWAIHYHDFIEHALKLAARLEHPSDDMLNALLKNTADHCVLDMHSNYMDMIAQLKKEV